MVAAVGVDDRDDPAERVGADRDEPRFALGVRILAGQAGGVGQGAFGVLEGDAVRGRIGVRLGGVRVGLCGSIMCIDVCISPTEGLRGFASAGAVKPAGLAGRVGSAQHWRQGP